MVVGDVDRAVSFFSVFAAADAGWAGHLYALWVAALASAAGFGWGAGAVLLVSLGAPVVGMAGLLVRERWRGAWKDARRFFLLRSRRELVGQLVARQRDLGARLDALYDHYAAREGIE